MTIFHFLNKKTEWDQAIDAFLTKREIDLIFISTVETAV